MAEMIWVEGGSISMGSGSGDPDEMPVREVKLDGFLIGKYPVTQKDWVEVFQRLPQAILDKNDNYPAVEISWYEAVAFCNKLSMIEGLQVCYSGSKDNIRRDAFANGYRLPTEAEWEYAAKGGRKSRNYLYSGSDDANEVAWYLQNSDKRLHPVGQKNPNELGIYDMSGNIYEFCNDVYGSYSLEDVVNPKGAQAKTHNPNRVIRGGNCFGLAYRVRSSARWKYKYMGFKHDFIGFRLARNAAAGS